MVALNVSAAEWSAAAGTDGRVHAALTAAARNRVDAMAAGLGRQAVTSRLRPGAHLEVDEIDIAYRQGVVVVTNRRTGQIVLVAPATTDEAAAAVLAPPDGVPLVSLGQGDFRREIPEAAL